MGKKQDLLAAAIPLFGSQGYDATTTFEFSTAAGVTEPVIYHHFKNKDGLFTQILVNTFEEYFSRLDALKKTARTEFRKIENLSEFENLRSQFVTSRHIFFSMEGGG